MQNTTSTARVAWVDTAKAAAIILVVLYHVGGTGIAHLLPGAEGWGVNGWRLVNSALLPVRMPLFFLASGLLAARAVERDWSRLWRPRLGNLLWPFVLWSVAFAGVSGFAYAPDDPAQYARDNLLAIPVGGTAYWYLATLVVFFVIARLLRPWAPAVLLAATTALALAPQVAPVLAEHIGPAGAGNAARLCYFAIWYFVGCFARGIVERIAAADRTPLLPVAGVVFAGVAYLVYVRGVSVPSTALSIAGLVAAVLASRWVASLERARRLSRYLAGRTLPIYVLHPILINLLIIATRAVGLPSWLEQPWAIALLVPLLTLALTWAAVVIHDAAGRARLGWLFSAPGAGRAHREGAPSVGRPPAARTL